MEVGDAIKIRLLAHELGAKVTEVEKYRGAYILDYKFVVSGFNASCAVFPELPNLPPASFFTQELYTITAWLTWKDHLWPVPMKDGRRRMVPGADPRAIMQRRIDIILNMVHANGMSPASWSMELFPQNEFEYSEWRKLQQNKGG